MTVGNVARANEEDTGPWDAALEQLRSWDPAWADTCAEPPSDETVSRLRGIIDAALGLEHAAKLS